MSDDKRTLVDGSPVTADHLEINPRTGQQKDYVVLSEEERAKGFVRPYRDTYTHNGKPGPANLRDLTDEEKERYSKTNYEKFEEYPEGKYSAAIGRFWTQEQLDNIGKGCGADTKMSRPIAETYARNPGFYSGTFCVGCKKHLPLDEFVWKGTNEQVGS
jgi:hypothetical protein